MKEETILRNLLIDELIILDKSISNFTYSMRKVEKIDLEADLSNDDFELFDSFSSRFLRLYEVLFNQVIRTTLGLLRESQKTVLDKADQLYLITSTADLDEIRKLHNQVAHEYLQHQWIEIYKNLILFSKPLLESCRMTRQFIKDRFPNINC